MRSGGKNWWLATLYDNLNRPVQTAMMTGTGYDRAGLQTYVNGLSDNTTASNTTIEITNGIPKDLVVNQYQNGVSLYEGSNSVILTDGFTTPDGAEITATINTGGNGATSVQQFVNINPIPSGVTLTALTYTHYDDYSWTSKQYATANNSKLSAGNSTYSEPLPTTMNTNVKGLVTGTRVRVLEDANDLTQGKWLEAANFYDSKGRVVQVQNTNYKGGLDVVTSLYDFTGKVLSSYQVHNNAGAGINNQSVLTVMEYDHAGRVTKVSKTINDDAARTRVIAQNTYDAFGQLKTKQLGQKTDDSGTPLSGQYLETQDYAYNIRGWLKGINWDGYGGSGGKTVAKSNRWFAFDLSYDWGYEHNQSNGNIAGMRWQTNGDQQERSYGYGYDNANRLMYGDFNEYRSSSWNKTNINFNVKMGDGLDYTSAYDENGNIKRMQQWGLKGTGSTQIDNLGYDYTYNGNDLSNKLRSVSEDATIGNTDNKLGDFTDKNRPGSGDDYDYDANGNLTKDKNKRIQTIVYNHLNMPYKIEVQSDNDNTIKGTITYIYDAAGNKVEKRMDELPASSNQQQGKQVTTTYLGSYVYENSVLQFFGQEEGRVRPLTSPSGGTGGGYVYDYFLKDHLGNVRMMLTDEHKQDNYPALTFENANKPTETALYENADVQLTARPGAFGDAGANGDQVQLLRKNVQSIGAGKLLKVMATDKVNVQVEYYAPSTTVDNTGANGLNTVVNSLVSLINGGAVGGAMHGAGSAVSSQLSSTSQFTDFLAPQNAGVPGSMPKAYLNILFFDEQFNFVPQNSELVPVSVWDAKTPIVRSGKEATKNGYVYIYVSNESNNLVYFDNLQVSHNRGPVLEETHYYPFGLTMAGISSKAAGGIENKNKYNEGAEINNDLGVDFYETDYRNYDAQTGRFHQIDPLADDYESWSPYTYSYNNPILWNDPSGLAASYNNWNAVFSEIMRQVEAGDLQPGRYYKASSGTIEFQTGTFSWNKETRLLDFAPDPVWISEPVVGADKGSTADRGHLMIHNVMRKYIPDQYMPYEESGWDYVPVVGASLKAIDHFKKGRIGWGIANALLAVSDFAAVKSVITTAGKATITLAARSLVKKAVLNPSLTAREAALMSRTSSPGLAALMRGKGIDRAFRELADENVVMKIATKLKILKINPSNRGADMIGKGLLKGSWWDVTTEGSWLKHVDKYGPGGIKLLY